MLIQTLIREKLSTFSQLSFCQKLFFLNQIPSCICSMCLHCIGKVSNCSIQSCGRSWSAHEGTIYAYTKALLGKNCQSSHSCHFVKNYFFWTKLLHAYVSLRSDCAYVQADLRLCWLHIPHCWKSHALAHMNMFERFDENPAMTLQDIKETKHYGRTHTRTNGQRENSITILYWFRSLSTVLSPTENSRIQGLFKAFEWFSSTFQGRFNFQGLFKKAL